METFQDAIIEKQTNMQVEEEDTEEMDLLDLNLDKLEKAIQDPIKGIIPAQHVVLLKEAIINKSQKSMRLSRRQAMKNVEEEVTSNASRTLGKNLWHQGIF